MKKIIAILLLFCMLVTATAFSESMSDLSIYTTEQLYMLLGLITNELNIRTDGEASLIPPGRYIAGESIIPGNYQLTAIEDLWGQVTVYESEEQLNQGNVDGIKSQLYLSNIGKTGAIHLEEGMVLLIEGRPLLIVETNFPWQN